MYMYLNKLAAFNTTFVITSHYKINEKKAVKGERYSEKQVFLEFI